MRVVKLAAVLVLAVTLAACADQPFAPEGPETTEMATAVEPSSSAASASVPSTGRHLVVFRRGKGAPSGFADEVAALGGTVDAIHDVVGAATVSGLGDAAARRLSRVRGVQIVEPEVAIPLPDPMGKPMTAEASGAVPASPEDPAAAFFFPRQWHHRAIDAHDAWAAGHRGSSDVTVAILDTGIGYQHADLAGLVDLSRSASFVPEDDAFVAFFFPGVHPITDIGFHGTHVAATVASNGFAAAGVTSGTTLIGAKVCSVFLGFCPGGAIFAGLIHAADAGADIANMSLGGGFAKRDFPGFVSVINRVFNYVRSQGMLVVVSAGNEAHDLDRDRNFYKTYCDTPHNVCVSATGPTAAASVNGPFTDVDALAFYSNFGRSAVDVAAPGGTNPDGNGGGLVWAACSPTSLVVPVCQTGTFVVGLGGTSMAAPHTSGVAALIAADGARGPAQIRSRLLKTSDDLGQPGRDPAYGMGRVNAFGAIR